MKILILDNYDSFTYNLVHYIKELTDQPVDVFRNDQIDLDNVDQYDHILLSPGPGLPDQAGILKPLISRYAETKSIFGVCLGMQAIAEVFGGKLINLEAVFHGLAMPIHVIDPLDITFHETPKQFNVGRYHSWVVSNDQLPECLNISAVDDEGRIMALKHKSLNVRGVQFHPESVLTEHGKDMLKNWLFPPLIQNRPELPSANSEKYNLNSFKRGFLTF